MSDRIEWPTVLLAVGTYLLWALATTYLAAFWLPGAVILAGICVAQHSSLSHEVLHGHPFRNQRLNEALVFPCLTLFVPYYRFRDTHLAHHTDANLTDPYDDPESNFLDPAVWAGMGAARRAVLGFNNTLLGRMLIGPLVALGAFYALDIRAIWAGDRTVRRAWLAHIPAADVVLMWVWITPMPLWAYITSAYLGLSLLKIRTFLEHRAHDRSSGRTVVIEDRGPLALLFLNNNYHVVHHMHPRWRGMHCPRSSHKTARITSRAITGIITVPMAPFFGTIFCARKTLCRIRSGLGGQPSVHRRRSTTRQTQKEAFLIVIAVKRDRGGRRRIVHARRDFGQNNLCDKGQIHAAHLRQRHPLQMR